MTTSALGTHNARSPELADPIGSGEAVINRFGADGKPDVYGVADFLAQAFLPEDATMASFLVNALYLFGDNTLIAYGGAPPGVTAELTRLGHKVAGAGLARERSPVREGRYDRALLLTQALGRGSDAEILRRLRALRSAVRPGGLVCFHIFDRDRAWFLDGERSISARGRNVVFRLRFDPASGRISAQPSHNGREADNPGAGSCVAKMTVKTWNRSELEALLRPVGLRLERVYADWSGAGPDAGESGRLIVVAAKPRRARKAIV